MFTISSGVHPIQHLSFPLSKQHLIAILATGKDKRTLADLVPKEALRADIRQDDTKEVRGPELTDYTKELEVHNLIHRLRRVFTKA